MSEVVDVAESGGQVESILILSFSCLYEPESNHQMMLYCLLVWSYSLIISYLIHGSCLQEG